MASRKTKAMWLVKDGQIELHMDSEAAKAKGWAEPEGLRSNGAPWNPEPAEGTDSQAESASWLQEANAKAEADRAAKAAKVKK